MALLPHHLFLYVTGAGSDLLTNNCFGLVVLDEATQCTEPESLVPLMRCKPEGQAILIGDHRQLPPTVLAPLAQEELSITLFERLINLFRSSPEKSAIDNRSAYNTMLDIQYRMHPLIAAWPFKVFYEDKIHNGARIADRCPPSGFPWPMLPEQFASGLERTELKFFKSPICFVNVTRGSDESRGKSKANDVEVQIVSSVVRSLLNQKPSDPDAVSMNELGIVTPYQAQVKALQNVFSSMGITMKAYSEEGEEDMSDGIEVKSVDGFQGREKDVIVFSAVRSNDNGNVGFLSDFRRLNVAMTRARRGMIVIGSFSTLKNDPYWSSWIDFMNAHELTLDAKTLMNW